jgi:hypothetical protein
MKLRGLFIAAGICFLLLIRNYVPIGGSMFGPLVSFAQPKAPEIPADFPSDVPVYPRHKLEDVSHPAGALMLDLTVSTDAQSVLTYYEQQFAAYGWQVSTASDEETEDGDGKGLSATKDGRTAIVLVTALKDNRSAVQQMIR